MLMDCTVESYFPKLCQHKLEIVEFEVHVADSVKKNNQGKMI